MTATPSDRLDKMPAGIVPAGEPKGVDMYAVTTTTIHIGADDPVVPYVKHDATYNLNTVIVHHDTLEATIYGRKVYKNGNTTQNGNYLGTVPLLAVPRALFSLIPADVLAQVAQ